MGGFVCSSDRDDADRVATNCCVGDSTVALYWAGMLQGEWQFRRRVPSAIVCLRWDLRGGRVVHEWFWIQYLILRSGDI
jgi:hypothetical protein